VKPALPLTDKEISNAKYEGKSFRLSDGKNMYVLVTKTGKYFRMNYRYGGKYKTIAFGVYPEVSLKKARIKRDEARQLLRQGIDPSRERKSLKEKQVKQTSNTDEICGHGFRAMASTILHGQGWKSDYIERQLAHEERNHVKAAYNHTQYLPERKEMMQA